MIDQKKKITETKDKHLHKRVESPYNTVMCFKQSVKETADTDYDDDGDDYSHLRMWLLQNKKNMTEAFKNGK